jgi:hypothetical protein
VIPSLIASVRPPTNSFHVLHWLGRLSDSRRTDGKSLNGTAFVPIVGRTAHFSRR